MIRFACPRCGMQLSAPEDCAGRSSKCRQCGQPVTVPAQRLPARQPVPVAVLPPAAIPVHPQPPAPDPCQPVQFPRADALPVLDALPAEPPPRRGARLKAPNNRRLVGLVALVLGAGLLAAGVLVTLVVVYLKSGGRGGVFDPNDVDRTAEWANSLENRLSESEREGNAIRFQHDKDEVKRLLATYAGKEVRWRFRVKRVNMHDVELETIWSVPGFLHPEHSRDLGLAPGKPVNMAAFSVGFYRPVPDLPAKHFPIRESLLIGTDIDPKLAVRLRPGGFIVVRGKVHTLAFGSACSCLKSSQAIKCILSDVSVAE